MRARVCRMGCARRRRSVRVGALDATPSNARAPLRVMLVKGLHFFPLSNNPRCRQLTYNKRGARAARSIDRSCLTKPGFSTESKNHAAPAARAHAERAAGAACGRGRAHASGQGTVAEEGRAYARVSAFSSPQFVLITTTMTTTTTTTRPLHDTTTHPNPTGRPRVRGGRRRRRRRRARRSVQGDRRRACPLRAPRRAPQTRPRQLTPPTPTPLSKQPPPLFQTTL